MTSIAAWRRASLADEKPGERLLRTANAITRQYVEPIMRERLAWLLSEPKTEDERALQAIALHEWGREHNG